MTADLAELRALAKACVDVDGGLPLHTDDELLRARLLSGETQEIRTDDGTLIGAASVTVREDGAGTSGLVHPDHRGQGHGRALLGWAVDRAGGVPLTVTCENVSASAERLYARFGLTKFMGEAVMLHPLRDVPEAPVPDGVTMVPAQKADLNDLFAAYVAAFRDRPGFPDPSQEEWLEELEEDDEWRRDISAVALDVAGAPVGFINVIERWVDQVGVTPASRGHRLGAHLVVRALNGLNEGGAEPVWLCVNDNNPPAANLFASLGFEAHGARGRWS